MKKILLYLKEVRTELKQVNWPSRDETLKSTMIVVGLSLAVALFLGAADLGFSQIISKLLEI